MGPPPPQDAVRRGGEAMDGRVPIGGKGHKDQEKGGPRSAIASFGICGQSLGEFFEQEVDDFGDGEFHFFEG